MSYIIAYDGTKYAIVINNYSQLKDFVASNPNAIASTGGFDPNSDIGIQSEKLRNLLVSQGYSTDEAYERTLAYLMKDAGVTLVKAKVGSDTFTKIGLQQKVDTNGNPIFDANNNPIYENADCQ